MRTLFLLAFTVLMPGCGDLLSVHPLATAETAVFDGTLIGEWKCVDKDFKGTVLIRAGEEKGYDIVWIPEEDGEEALRMRGQLVKVGGRQVFDLLTAKRPDLAIPGHFFMLMEKTADGVKFRWLDSEWLRKQVIAPGGLAHAMVGEKPVITAGSREMNAFLAKFGLDARAGDSMTFKRIGG